MLTLPSTCACAFVCGGCGLSSALHAGPPASHHALTTIAASHRVVLMLASLEECGTADAHSTPERHGLTMPRISDRFDPGGERAPLLLRVGSARLRLRLTQRPGPPHRSWAKERRWLSTSVACAYLVGVGTGEASEIRVPLPRQERPLLDVAVLAGGRDVALDGAAAADQRHHVIEGEGARAHRAGAIVAPPVGNAPLPPAALAKLARAGPLAPEGGGVLDGNEALRGRHGFSTEARESERSSHSFMSQATCCSASLRCCAMVRARSPSR